MGNKTPTSLRFRTSQVQSRNSARIEQALVQRVDQRSAASGFIQFPAVPALLDHYVELCAAIFKATGRGFTSNERAQARDVIVDRLHRAFNESPRSKVVIHFEAQSGCTLGYEVRAEISTIADAYERWIGTSDQPLFGTQPDARVWSLAEAMRDAAACPMLDLGAGTGRNALALARRGHPVDAVEITPKFAALITAAAQAESLPVRVVVCDAFRDNSTLRRDYAMLFASEVVPDFRSVDDLRQLFALAAEVLADDGLLVFNIHLTAPGYTPERAVREFAQQCYSALYTPGEVVAAAAGMPFQLVANDSVHDFEREHLPSRAWPPTPWFINWSLGVDVLEMDRDKCPIELRWLVFRKTPPSCPSAAVAAATLTVSPIAVDQLGIASAKSRRVDAQRIRQALLLRLRRRWLGSGSYVFPAVPALREHFVAQCLAMFEALGRQCDPEQMRHLNQSFEQVLLDAFARSPRSNIIVNYDAAMGTELRYTVTADAVPLTDMYEQWLEQLPAPLFGELPDARLVALLQGLGSPQDCPVLDLGAGTGRNALYLAERSYPVDAVECVPRFAALMREHVGSRQLRLRVVPSDLFEYLQECKARYALCVASGVASDFRDANQLSRFFRLVAPLLDRNGLLLMSVHLAAPDYRPDATALQWAAQCCAMFYTRGELADSVAGCGLELTSDDSAIEFESTYLPNHAFPPTPAYPEWAACTHMFALGPEQSPVELRWLVFRTVN